MMKDRTFGSPDPGISIKRDHSPYCESKGPIIQEGFVAQRIRALQELQAYALAGNRSHSPMIACPPRWVRSYEPLSPPRSALAPQPAVKVPAMSEFGAIKHHWASMPGTTREAMVEGANCNAASHWQSRSSQRPLQSSEWDKPQRVANKAVQGINTNIKKWPGNEQSQEYQQYIEPPETTRSVDITFDRPTENRVIELGEPYSVSSTDITKSVDSTIELGEPYSVSSTDITKSVNSTIELGEPYSVSSTDITKSVNSTIELGEPYSVSSTNITKSVNSTIEQSSDGQESMPSELRTRPTTATQGNESTTVEPHGIQEIDLDEPQNTTTRTTQSVDSPSETPTSSQGVKPGEAHIISKKPSQNAVGEWARSEKYVPDDSRSPNLRTSPSFDDGIQTLPSRYTPSLSEPEILGPNPILASLADPSVLSHCITPKHPRDCDNDQGYDHEQTSRQPRKSVADKLGFLVERGWVGCDVFGRAYNEHTDFESLSNTSQTKGNRADSRCVSSNQDTSRSKSASHDNPSSGSSTNGGSESHGVLQHDTSHMDKAPPRALLDLDTPRPRNLKRREIHRSHRTFSFERSSSNIGSWSVKTSVSSPTSKRRVFSLQQLYRLRRSNSEGIELRSFSPDDTATGRQDYIPLKLWSQEKVSSESNPKDIIPGDERERILSASASRAPRSRQSSISRNDYARPSSRSSSWFKKSWLKPLLGDGKVMLEEDALKDHSTSTSASVSTDGAQEDPFSRSKQQVSGDVGTANTLTEADQSGGSETPMTSTITEFGPKEHKNQRKSTVNTSTGDPPMTSHDQQISHSAQTSSNSPPTSPLQIINDERIMDSLEQDSHKHAQNHSKHSETSMTSLHNPLPSRRSSKRAVTTPSKSANFTSENSANSVHSPQGELFSTSQHPRKVSPTSSISISVRIHRTNRLSPVPLDYLSESPRAGSTAEQPQQQTLEEEAVHRGLERGKALRKIQVIISFDGAEDLIVETTAAGDAAYGN